MQLTRLKYIPKEKNHWPYCICLFSDGDGNLYKYVGKDIPSFTGGFVVIDPQDKGEQWDGMPCKYINKIKLSPIAVPNWADPKTFKKYAV